MASTRPGGELHWICQIHFHVQTTLKRRTQLADCVVRGQIVRCAESDTTNARRRNASRQLFTAIPRCPSTTCRHRKHRRCRSSHTVSTHTPHQMCTGSDWSCICQSLTKHCSNWTRTDRQARHCNTSTIVCSRPARSLSLQFVSQ